MLDYGPGAIGVAGEHRSADVALDLVEEEPFSGDTVAMISLHLANVEDDLGLAVLEGAHVDIELTLDDLINLRARLSKLIHHEVAAK